MFANGQQFTSGVEDQGAGAEGVGWRERHKGVRCRGEDQRQLVGVAIMKYKAKAGGEGNQVGVADRQVQPDDPSLTGKALTLHRRQLFSKAAGLIRYGIGNDSDAIESVPFTLHASTPGCASTDCQCA